MSDNNEDEDKRKANLEFLAGFESDVIFYCGSVNRDGYSRMSDLLEGVQTKRKSVCLILCTLGGDADAAYRIARALNHHYEKVSIFIGDMCKSAGTLLCIGGHDLIIGDRGELGPLDVQISKPDELFEQRSGLDVAQAIIGLERRVMDSFRKYLLDIRTGAGLSTRIAADIAVEMTKTLISPIASKIDPLTWGEHQRAIQIAFDYGHKLAEKTKSIDEENLTRLITGFPSHGFVIDRKEARSIFKNVSAPSGPFLTIEKIALDWLPLMKRLTNPFIGEASYLYKETTP